jgi:diacylglycerol kinase family enzyme
MVNPREASFEVASDHASSVQKAKAAVFANTHCYAKGWSMAPAACMDDGMLDLVARHHSSPGVILRAFYAASRRRRPSANYCRYGRSRQFFVQSDTPLAIQADGDPLPPARQMTVTLLPKQLRLITPP